jgi:hypothetical protein
MRRIKSARVEAMECTPQQFSNLYTGAALILYEIKGGELKRPLRIKPASQTVSGATHYHEGSPRVAEGIYDPEMFEDRRFQREAFVLLESFGPNRGRTITVGRTGNSDVVINDYTVSANHAIFDRSYEGNGPHIGCAGGRNGTYVNGSIVESGEFVPVVTGDLVRLGRVEMIYVAQKDLYAVLRRELEGCPVSTLMGWGA